ncbi:hypothetical protein N7471_002290 [Penicillium samsonianum]|uniref:uncharacterized protein n=1 Tax=Penicillium samsonianum TaxID=1882272 RepID=UPI0025480BF3|nr:uncharacterized protein N7471_002290 [Penicillium samsonianum]KAJ6142837.1 hypothetical protein N7471_002290 [Penicillium samsonianum]
MPLLSPISQCISSLARLNHKWGSRKVSRKNEGWEKPLSSRLLDVFLRTWDLGFTAFGGPPVHFQILHSRFVEGQGDKEKWVDEQTYQELFAICQGLPGPGSTKMLFCLVLLHAGFIPATLAFFLWSLPGAIGMYALSLGVQNMSETLPKPVYSLLSGLNASTVGIVALAAVQLAEKAIRDKLSRILVIFGACAGLCYNALWYFPVLMIIGGFLTSIWDGWLYQQVLRVRIVWKNRHARPQEPDEANGDPIAMDDITLEENRVQRSETMRPRKTDSRIEGLPQSVVDTTRPTQSAEAHSQQHIIRIRVGALVMGVFFASFIGVLLARAQLTTPPLVLDLFANMYLAGTVIFGGGPVVIPLLRTYVVDPGWVSSRDFLIGLAIIQAFPGPNFNFAVFLGALALQNSRFPTVFGAFLGGLGIFLPGITLAVAIQSFWRVLRKKKYVVDFLRGVNATAVGLVFTAVYRLWEIGYLTHERSNGQSLGKEPWWVVVATVTYAGSAWFNVPPPVAIGYAGLELWGDSIFWQRCSLSSLTPTVKALARALGTFKYLAVRGQQPLHMGSGVVLFVDNIRLYLDSPTPESPSPKLAHQYVFVTASLMRYRAMLLKKVCNEAQKTRYLESVDPDAWLSKRARPLEQAQNQGSVDPHPFRTEWTLRKCFCILAGGLAIQTQDGWIYVLRRNDMKPFIEAGIVEDIDFHDRDVEDRAKADSLGKTFTVLQTSWFLVNIIARWANSLPVSPIELATVAYIACGILLYAMWWYNPKDMTTPITIYVRFDRNDIPTHLLDHTATNPHGWVHRYAQIKKETVFSVFAQAARWFIGAATGPVDTTDDPYTGLYKPSHGLIVTAINTFVAFLYCGIHLAGWTFPFPTEAERITWLVSSLACVALVGIYSLAFNARKGFWYRIILLVELSCFAIYVILRLIIMALAFTSLRALPVGSYTTVEWVMSIPHV